MRLGSVLPVRSDCAWKRAASNRSPDFRLPLSLSWREAFLEFCGPLLASSAAYRRGLSLTEVAPYVGRCYAGVEERIVANAF